MNPMVSLVPVSIFILDPNIRNSMVVSIFNLQDCLWHSVNVSALPEAQESMCFACVFHMALAHSSLDFLISARLPMEEKPTSSAPTCGLATLVPIHTKTRRKGPKFLKWILLIDWFDFVCFYHTRWIYTRNNKLPSFRYLAVLLSWSCFVNNCESSGFSFNNNYHHWVLGNALGPYPAYHSLLQSKDLMFSSQRTLRLRGDLLVYSHS